MWWWRGRHCFRWWLGAGQDRHRYLNKWWHSLSTDICDTRWGWINCLCRRRIALSSESVGILIPSYEIESKYRANCINKCDDFTRLRNVQDMWLIFLFRLWHTGCIMKFFIVACTCKIRRNRYKSVVLAVWEETDVIQFVYEMAVFIWFMVVVW